MNIVVLHRFVVWGTLILLMLIVPAHITHVG
jgi:hypothetical protein